MFFGGKGTGKTDILMSFRDYFIARNGQQLVSYYKAKEVVTEFSILRANELKEQEYNQLEYFDVSSDIKIVKEWEEKAVTPTSEYYLWKEIESTNKNNKLLGFRSAQFVEELSLDKYNDLEEKFSDFRGSSIVVLETVREENLLDENEIRQLEKYLTDSEIALYKKARAEWISYKALELEKFTIDTVKRLSEGKTGEKSKPTNLGLFDTYLNLKKVKASLEKIGAIIENNDETIKYLIGELEEKGKIYLERHITTNMGVSYFKFDKGKANVQDVNNSVSKCISELYTTKFPASINDLMTKLKEFESTRDFIGYKTIVALENGDEYTPSDGEQSMLLLSKALVHDEKAVYILDEPELSVGHQYINNVIIPRIKELARRDKVIIIATHDANIAVRTLPYLSVFRKYENGKYYNYIGSSLEQNMCDAVNGVTADWTEVCIKTLEGGRDAFDERGRIYG